MPRKLYDQQYKTQAIKLAQTQGINKTAENLGINPNMLGRWKREFETSTSQGRPTFTGRGVIALSEQEQEIQRLRKELEIARLLDPKMHLRAGSQERDILKKAVTFLIPGRTFLPLNQHLTGLRR